MKLESLALGAVVSLAVFSQASPALANGRYPASGQIAIDPADPAHIIVRATYGVLSTSDGGASWGWICEGSIGYGGSEDPMILITKDSSVLAGVFSGLSTSRDRGCQWGFTGGALTSRYVTDLSSERGDPAKSVLLISQGMSKDIFLTQVWESPDNAKAWTQAGVDLPSSFLGLTLDTAPSDPGRIYVSGRFGSPDYAGAIQRSKDRGKTWESLPIPGANDLHLPFIAAIDPMAPDVLYVRLDGDKSDSLQVSKDGGATWKEVFTATSLIGLALSPDGSTIAAGSDKDGLWTAPTSSLAFTKVSDLSVRCLTWTEKGLYACADEYKDHFTAGLSTDAGKTFTPILSVQSALCGPLTCGPETSTGKTCPVLWGATKLSINACTSGADAGPDGGESSGSSASSSASSSGGGGGGSTGGCSYVLTGEARWSAFGAASISMLGFVALLGRRRKKRSSV